MIFTKILNELEMFLDFEMIFGRQLFLQN